MGAHDGGDLVIHLFAGLVVAPAEAVADLGERLLCLAQRSLPALGHRRRLFGGPDVGHPPAAGFARVGIDRLEGAQRSSVAGAAAVGQRPLAPGDVVDGAQALVAHLIEEPPGETRRLPEGDDEPQPGPVSGAEVLDVPEGGVGADRQTGATQLGQALEGGPDAGQLGGVAGMGSDIEGDTGGSGGLEDPHLAGHLPVGPPPLGHQRGTLVGAGHPQGGQVEMQSGGVHPEAFDGQRVTAPRTPSATRANASRARPRRSSLSNIPGTPTTSWSAAPEAHPATS